MTDWTGNTARYEVVHQITDVPPIIYDKMTADRGYDPLDDTRLIAELVERMDSKAEDFPSHKKVEVVVKEDGKETKLPFQATRKIN